MEVMGLMLGEFVDDYTVRVIDVFAMPQSGTVRGAREKEREGGRGDEFLLACGGTCTCIVLRTCIKIWVLYLTVVPGEQHVCTVRN